MPEQVAVEETPGPEVEGGRTGVAVGGRGREGGREGGVGGGFGEDRMNLRAPSDEPKERMERHALL